jgi:phospholipid/cholesterol/gamma-HCH transport system ATP-binding protein
MTCAENLRLGLIRRGLPPDEMDERVGHALALVGLPDVSERMPAELSGGMRKRVGIARAIALKPRYILWDEPTTGLDPVTTATMSQVILRVRDELGATSLVVTHDLAAAFTIGDRFALLHEGAIAVEGTADELRSSDHPFVMQFLAGRPE